MQSSEFVNIFGSRSYSLFQLSDAKLRTDDGCTFDIHRIILARNNDYFAALFCGMNSDRREFTIPGMSGECLSNILCYVYTGDIQITERNVRDLMLAADYLLLKDLQIKIKQCIKANMTELNCLGVLQAARQISDEDIFQECFRIVQTRFEGLVRYQKDEVTDLPMEIFRSILSNRSLYVYNEMTVWQSIVEWTQKDIPSRMCCVPQLLLTLAIEDMGEELATEILQHEIISKNSLMKDVIEIRSSNDFTSNLDVFVSILRSYSNSFTQPYSHRIPLNLYVISSYTGGPCRDRNSNIYITYDENPDLWRKITEVNFNPDFLIAIGHNIYVFESDVGCMNFDLSVMEWGVMENFTYEYYEYRVLDIDAYIYIIGKNSDNETYVVEVYDIANNRWFNGVSPINIHYGASVAIGKKIFLVGSGRNFDGMMTQMFDPVTQQWSLLSPPIINRSYFELVAYRQKIYLLGGSRRELDDFDIPNAEVFDPTTNLWKELPHLPDIYLCTKAVVLNDQMIVYDGNFEDERHSENVRWNDTMECWEIFHKTYTFQNFLFCSVDDVDTIRMITKQNRNPNTQMQKSLFI